MENLIGDAQLYDSMLRDGLNDAFRGEHSGWHTEDLVAKHGITRGRQDAWALRSQQQFAAAQAAGKFAAEIVPIEIKARKGPELFAKDEHNRPDTTACPGRTHLPDRDLFLPGGLRAKRRNRNRRQTSQTQHTCQTAE